MLFQADESDIASYADHSVPNLVDQITGNVMLNLQKISKKIQWFPLK